MAPVTDYWKVSAFIFGVCRGGGLDVCAAPMGMLPAGGPGVDMLASWAEGLGQSRAGVQSRECLRFAFYGRVSTEDWQDPVTSRARQLQQAVMLTAGHGTIVAQFFDTGESRTLPWARRPQAAALVAQLADPDRGWGAIVIGEYERAFYGNQYASMAPLFEHYGIALWMPEVGGRWTGTPRTMSRPCSHWDCRPSGRSPGPGSGSAPRWPPRPASRAGTWAGVRRTGTGSLMRGRIRTRRMQRGAVVRTGWSRTRPQRRS
jgi:hypothetical protein